MVTLPIKINGRILLGRGFIVSAGEMDSKKKCLHSSEYKTNRREWRNKTKS